MRFTLEQLQDEKKKIISDRMSIMKRHNDERRVSMTQEFYYDLLEGMMNEGWESLLDLLKDKETVALNVERIK